MKFTLPFLFTEPKQNVEDLPIMESSKGYRYLSLPKKTRELHKNKRGQIFCTCGPLYRKCPPYPPKKSIKRGKRLLSFAARKLFVLCLCLLSPINNPRNINSGLRDVNGKSLHRV